MKNGAMLRVQNLGKKYNHRWVLRGVNFELKSGETLIVTGVNGSGKSTLLKLIAGILSPSEGESIVLADDEALNADCKRKCIGLAAPDMHLYPTLSSKEHLEFFTKLRGIDEFDSNELLKEYGLEGRENEPMSTYSTGMKQRVRLALAAFYKPDILLLDEPGSGLDEQGREVLANVISGQKLRGLCIIATNDSREKFYGNLELKLGS